MTLPIDPPLFAVVCPRCDYSWVTIFDPSRETCPRCDWDRIRE